MSGGSGPSHSSSTPEASAAVRFAMATAGALAALEVAALAARDGLFLSEVETARLPLAMMGSAALAITATLGLSGWMRRSRPDRVAPLLLATSGVAFAALGILAPTAPALAATLLYLHVAGLTPLIVSAFWSIVNERFDPYTAKRAISRMAAAGALGGVIGGIGAERIATLLGVSWLLLALGATSAVCAFGTLRIGAPDSPMHAAEPEPGESGLRVLTRRPLLRQMALLMLLVAIVEILVDYALKVEAAAALSTGNELVRFFAVFYTTCGLLSFVIQASMGDAFLRRYGLAAAVALLPASVALTSALATATARFWGFILTRGAETVASSSFFRAGFQLLYTPVPPAAKRPAKVWVDVASGSVGELIGAGLIFGALALIPGLPSAWVVGVAATGCVMALLVVRRIHTSYVAQLSDSLKRGRVEIRAEDALDATTARTIAESAIALDRRTLLEQAREHHARTHVEALDPVKSEHHTAPPEDDPTAEWIRELGSGDPRRARRVLKREIAVAPGSTLARRRRLAPHVIPLLGDDAIARDAEDFLRGWASRITGQLVDELLDAEQPEVVRVRLAGLLARVTDARAMEGLWRCAPDASFDVRLACARAAARITARAPELAPEMTAVYARVEAELGMDDEVWQRQGRRPPARSRSVLLDRRALGSVSRSLEHVFTLLSLAHEREVMASALAGLATNDPALRGTALEYLESVLPAPLRRALWPRLHAEETRPAGPTDRSQAEITEELMRSSTGLVLDREALSKS